MLVQPAKSHRYHAARPPDSPGRGAGEIGEHLLVIWILRILSMPLVACESEEAAGFTDSVNGVQVTVNVSTVINGQ
jgi:hypothetical protein